MGLRHDIWGKRVVSDSDLDPRVRRTRRLLQEAVLSLAEERDFAAITVRDIAKRAEVNRATFYLHYQGKEDLAAQALDALFNEVTADSRAYLDGRGKLSPEITPPSAVALFHHLTVRRALYRRLLGGGMTAFAERFRLFEQGQFFRFWEEMRLSPASGSPPVELRAQTAIGIVQSTVTWWLERDEPPAPEQMADWLWQLLIPLWFTDVETIDKA